MMNNTKRAGRKWILIVSVLLIMTVFFGCGSEKQQSGSAEDETSSKLEYSGFDELAGERIGVVPVYADRVKELIPTAELLFYDGSANMNQALRSHKIAAYTEDESIIKVMAEGDDEISWIPDHIETANIACAFPMDEKGEKLRFEVNEFILKLKENGTLDSMLEIWTGETKT